MKLLECYFFLYTDTANNLLTANVVDVSFPDNVTVNCTFLSSATRRLLVVSVCKEEREDMYTFKKDLFIAELFVGEKTLRSSQNLNLSLLNASQMLLPTAWATDFKNVDVLDRLLRVVVFLLMADDKSA